MSSFTRGIAKNRWRFVLGDVWYHARFAHFRFPPDINHLYSDTTTDKYAVEYKRQLYTAIRIHANLFGVLPEEFHLFSHSHAFTLCNIENEDRGVIAAGFAFCSPRDQFNKSLGREISFMRAYDMLSEIRGVF